ncbi:DNA mismatch endonuclease Vsr [Mariniblastus sp.]|nr:DNA mismatch endonuclease Vsr [Mariniblastus sp.]
MTDIVDRQTRSRMMSKIGGRDTKPELLIRSGLHRLGFRYSLHRKDLPGKPDIVLPAYDTVIFVHGCFWHCHEGCEYFRMPKSNKQFWKDKLGGNKKRDQKNVKLLLSDGWYVGTVWECVTRNRTDEQIERAVKRIANWIAREAYKRQKMEFTS